MAFEASAERARDARVHLDHDHPPGGGVDRELDVGAAGIDPDLAQDRDRGVAHPLVFLVGQGQRGRHGDAVAGVDAHRIDVLDRADDDAVVRAVADHLHLVLLPAQDRLVDLDLADRRGLQARDDDLVEFLAVVGDAAAGAAQREGGPDDRRQADLGQGVASLRPATARPGSAAGQARSAPWPGGTARGPRPWRWPRGEAPISSTPNRSSVPSRASAMATLSAVWPPMVGSSASGRSRSMILATIAGVTGSM